jgi:Arc/MetJ family transcription regulator
MQGMKTTIDIPDKELRDAMKYTGARSKREAVVTALADFNRRQRLQRLAQQFGTFDEFLTHEELRRMREET